MGIMADFKRWEEKVKKAIPSALKDDVVKVVKEDFMYIAQTAVYGSYAPKYYLDGSVFGRERRFAAGGIYDLGMIKDRLEGAYTLSMENIAPANSDNDLGRSAIEWVESGLNVPLRHFYKPLEAYTTPHAHEALVAGLHKRGL